MADITLISGSTLGSAEYVAEHLAELLEQQGFSTDVQRGPQLDELPQIGIWLLVSSAHGAGELTDNLQPLFKQISDRKADLSQVRYCAIVTVDRILVDRSAKRIGEMLQIDITEHDIPEDPTEIWLAPWVELLN
ncbi:MAG: flavodoxin domain-containing protein [Symbiopectobacterium sp.]|uniref:flavodoxin domain-containing protein n=1 Tax=Symbiopectobacterium sp. TaxID=2952789 RepID=UPI003F2D7B5B